MPAQVRGLFTGLVVFKAVFAALSSLVFAVLGPFVLGQVAKVSSEQNVALDGVTAFFVVRPYLIAAMCIPTFAASVLAIVDRKRRWMWLIVTTVLLLAMLAILLLAMMKLLAPLYNPQL
jgi:predicted Na+-dependent transporter